MRRAIAVLLLATMVAVAGCSGQAGVKKVSKEEAVKMSAEAITNLNQGNVQKAKELVEVAVASNPEDAKTQFLAGILAFNDKAYDKAIAAYEKAIKLDPNMVEAYNNLGNTYRDMGKTEEAAKSYEKAAQLNSKFAFAYTNHALMLSNQGKKQEAIVILEKGAAADEGNMDIRLLLADMYIEVGSKDKARSVLEAILKAQPGLKAAADKLQELK